MNVDLSNKMVQTHIVPRGTQGWGLKGKAGECRGEGSAGLEGTEELPLLHCTRPQGEAGLICDTNLADRRARKIREGGTSIASRRLSTEESDRRADFWS